MTGIWETERNSMMMKNNKRIICAVLLCALALAVPGCGGTPAYGGQEPEEGTVDDKMNGEYQQMEGVDFNNGFYNPIKDDHMLGDPWMVQHDGYYYYTQSGGNHIVVLRSRTITGISAGAEKEIWNISNSDNLTEIWAPELHYYDGSWYCYFTARMDRKDELRRIFVLKARTEDPLGEWDFIGKLELPQDQWAIDATFMEHEGKLYLLWSGWKDVSEGPGVWKQNIYICELEDPVTVRKGTDRVKLTGPEYSWETVQFPQTEGPEILKSPDGKVFCIYSASFSKSDSYCLGMLELTGDPMNAGDWIKSTEPVFASNPEEAVYSPGHCSFVKSPDQTQDWIIYHAAKDAGAGWDRSARAQKFSFDGDGRPVFCSPCSLDTQNELPSGEKVVRRLYEAEDGEMNQAQVRQQTGASGGKLVALPESDSALTFHISVPEAGSYAAYVRYSNQVPMQAGAFITVNAGKFEQRLFERCPSAGGKEYGLSVTQISLDLQKGENTILFEGARDILLDCLILEKKEEG